MNIIFKKNLSELGEKYVVLDLDTFSMPDGTQHTACCIIENIPITELPAIENLKELHANLIKNYGIRDWNYCEQAIEQLMGKWGGEMDTFYVELLTRIEKLKELTLDNTWTPIIARE